MYEKLMIEGNAVYEIDEECLKKSQARKGCSGLYRGNGSVFRPEPPKGTAPRSS